MNTTIRAAFLLIFWLFVPQVVHTQSTVTKPAAESLVFGGDSFGHAVPLPRSVLDALVATRQAAYARDWARDNPGQDLNPFFKAAGVHLSRFSELDYVVFGQFPLTGADSNWYWVVSVGSAGPRIVLFDDVNRVELLESFTNGYRDVRAAWWSPNERVTRIYHYDGIRYRLAHKYDRVTMGKP